MNTILAPFSTYLSAGLVFPFMLVLIRLTAALMASPGGQPSTTQPIAGPCDSPNDVTANRVPMVLPDIAAS